MEKLFLLLLKEQQKSVQVTMERSFQKGLRGPLQEGGGREVSQSLYVDNIMSNGDLIRQLDSQRVMSVVVFKLKKNRSLWIVVRFRDRSLFTCYS